MQVMKVHSQEGVLSYNSSQYCEHNQSEDLMEHGKEFAKISTAKCRSLLL